MALGERDTFDYVLARDLGMSLGQVRALPFAEFVEWSAFYKYEWAMADLEARTLRGRSKGTG